MPAEFARLTGMKAVFEKEHRPRRRRLRQRRPHRLPIRRHENHKLPSNYKGEQRGVLEIELGDQTPKEPLLFLATHLDYRPDDHERMCVGQEDRRDPRRPA